MCWSASVSFWTGSIVYISVCLLIIRSARRTTAFPRYDVMHALFLFVFGSMQWLDYFVWSAHAADPSLFLSCSAGNHFLTRFALIVIQIEPLALLTGRALADGKLPTWKEIVAFLVAAVLLPMVWIKYSVQVGDCQHCVHDSSCTQISNAGNLVYGVAYDNNNRIDCWQSSFFPVSLFASASSSGANCQSEIPLVLRVGYVLMMVYCYLTCRSGPLLSRVVQSAILTCTWLIGYFFAPAHASVWCLANVFQCVTMLLDPYFFYWPNKKFESKPPILPKFHQRYNTSDALESPWDVIIIGSGIGSLVTSALLSRLGKRVLILEAHYRPGGCCHSFDEVGNSVFDSGIHYLGAREMLEAVINRLSDTPIYFDPIGSAADGYRYDIFQLEPEADSEQKAAEKATEGLRQFSSKSFISYRKGLKALMDELVQQFADVPGIQWKIRVRLRLLLVWASVLVRIVVLMRVLPSSWQRVQSFLSNFLFKQMCGSAVDVFSRYVLGVSSCASLNQPEKRLLGLLTGGQYIDWSLNPDRASWWVVASMLNYYEDGACYPRATTQTFIDGLISTVLNAGGKVLCRAEVKRILLNKKDGKVKGVEMLNGDEIEADIVISNTGFETTRKLLGHTHAHRGVIAKKGSEEESARNEKEESKENTESTPVQKLSERPPISSNSLGVSNGHVTAFITLSGDTEDLGIVAANIHSMPGLCTTKYDYNLSKMQNEFLFGNFIGAMRIDSTQQKEEKTETALDFEVRLPHSDAEVDHWVDYWSERALITLTSPSAKDLAYYRSTYPGTANVLLLCDSLPASLTERLHGFHSQPYGHRSAAYSRYKSMFEKLFVRRLHQLYPRTKGRVLYIEIGSAFSSKHFINSTDGESYGYEWTPQRFEPQLFQRLHCDQQPWVVKGMYITGESSFFGGFAGAMISGLITAFHVAGINNFLQWIINAENIQDMHGHDYEQHHADNKDKKKKI